MHFSRRSMARCNSNPIMNVHHGGVKAILRWFAWLVAAGLAVHAAAWVPHGLAGEDATQVVHLYFADANKPFLAAESRVMVNSGDPVAFGRQLVLELISGPAGAHLATIAKATQLRSFFLLGDGTAVVDFSIHFRENHPGSCRQEQLTLFSVVNTLILNVPEIDQVKILIDGIETQTLAGHLPLEFPLTADLLLTR